MAYDKIITFCDGTRCMQSQGRALQAVLEQELERNQLKDRVKVTLSGCLGMCDKGPIMLVNPGYTIYGNLQESDIPEIVAEHVVKGNPVSRLVIQEDHLFNRFFRIFGDAKFFGKQMRIVGALRLIFKVMAGRDHNNWNTTIILTVLDRF